MIGLFSSLSSNRSRMKLVASDVAAVPVAALLLWGLFRDMGGFGPPGVWALILLPLAMWGVAQLSFLLMFLQRGCWTDTVHRLVLTTLSSLLSVLGLFSADMPVPGDLVALVAMTFFATATALHAIMRLALPHMSAPGHSGKAAPAKASKAPHALLGRAEIGMSHSADFKSYADRVVLVSGAGGSIGSELVRQILPCRPRKIVLFELNETALYDIHRTIKAAASGTNTLVVPVLGSVADPGKVRRTLRTHQVQVVLHAAAYKHVPLVEENPLAGLSNNVVGTQTLVDEAVAAQVERFVLISSDKAVRPINVMGASKRLCELVIQDAVRKHAGATGPVFATVRFGNVLGSSGSVLPLFEEQVRAGGPVTVTDPDVSRYFMTVQEAVHLVLHAGAMACGGEVFVLDMGQPVRIDALARQVIHNAGLTVRDATQPDGDIEIRYVGLRCGEKMREELTFDGCRASTTHPQIFTALEKDLSEFEIASALRALRHALATEDEDDARAHACQWVAGVDVPDPPALLAARIPKRGMAAQAARRGPMDRLQAGST